MKENGQINHSSELFHRELRRIGHYGALWEQWFEAPSGEWSARDQRSINRTFSGLTKLIFPAGTMEKQDAELLLRLAIEMRLRVRYQLYQMSPREFPFTRFSYSDFARGGGAFTVLLVGMQALLQRYFLHPPTTISEAPSPTLNIRPVSYSPFRSLKTSVYNNFCKAVCNNFCNGTTQKRR